VRRALVALGALVLLATGVAVATPVPVLAVRDGDRQYLALLGNGDELIYSYRQSIYGVTVSEHFVRDGERLRLRRVFSQDIRAIEYFRWDTPINSDGGDYVAEAPPTVVPELHIRITSAGEQRLLGLDGDWRLYLLDWFGENAVRVRVEQASLLHAVLQGLHR
jgi:hypothetical protein